MGVDWVRMSPSPQVARGLLEELIDRQAAEFMLATSVHEDDFRHLGLQVSAVVPDSGALAGHVELDNGPGSVRRVNFVTRCQALPAEWRCAAYRSYLPGQLADTLRTWGSHLDQVKAGAHWDYYYAWYRYSTEHQLATQWLVLRERALASRDRTNSWARRPGLIDVRERILSAPSPSASPAPHWGRECAVSADDGSYDATVTLAREWNRRVPQNQKVSAWHRSDFPEFMASRLDDSWLREGLTWLRRTVDDGRGLLLDW